MKPLLVTSGEPAGIGPDLCLALANSTIPLVVLGDQALLEQRARALNMTIEFINYQADKPTVSSAHKTQKKTLAIINLPSKRKVISGKLDPLNAEYVLNMLTIAASRCLQGEFAGLVTAPVHKGIINQAGIVFSGHTEFFAQYSQIEDVVMLLACETMKVALVTTHLPLQQVAEKISKTLIVNIIQRLYYALKVDLDILKPVIHVAGLNPHAGEGGYLGREEIEIIIPALQELKARGLDIHGPFPADTLFTHNCDVFVAMYHDQGLPVLKYAGFGKAVNITIGLPFIRTSVDHGTALELVGKGLASPDSLIAAVKMAASIASKRYAHH